MKYIYHHLGLGDHIICNGLVRFFQKKFNVVSVFVKNHNFQNVKYMFRDNSKINLINLSDDEEVLLFIKNNNLKDDLIKVGHEKLGIIPYKTFDEGFYSSVDVPFSVRFDEFYLERELDKEIEIFNKLNPENKDYIFTHSVSSEKHRQDLLVIENPAKYNLFNLIYLIENATEVHLMESSLKNVVNSFKMKNPKFFYHQYVRNYPENFNSQGLNNFEIIY